MATKLVVIHFQGSAETEAYLAERHKEAALGDLIGCAGIWMYSQNNYAIAIKGEIRRSPIITRGLLPELDYRLGKIIRSR